MLIYLQNFRRCREVKKILQFGGISVRFFEILPESADEFSVYTAEGWKILYVQGSDVRQQTDSLLTFLKETITSDVRKNLEYVDRESDCVPPITNPTIPARI